MGKKYLKILIYIAINSNSLNLYSTNSQQQLRQGALYFKRKIKDFWRENPSNQKIPYEQHLVKVGNKSSLLIGTDLQQKPGSRRGSYLLTKGEHRETSTKHLLWGRQKLLTINEL